MGKKINTLVLLTLAMCVCTSQIAVANRAMTRNAFLDKIANKFVRIRWIAELPVTERVLVPVKIKKDNVTRWMLRALHVPNKNDKSTWFVVRRDRDFKSKIVLESLFAGRRYVERIYEDTFSLRGVFMTGPEDMFEYSGQGLYSGGGYKWVVYARGEDVENAGVWLGSGAKGKHLQIPPGNPTGLGAYLADAKGSKNIRSAFVIELVDTTEVPPPAVVLPEVATQGSDNVTRWK